MTARNHPAPDFHLVVDGRDITTAVDSRLESLTLTDNRGMDADELELVLSDHDNSLHIPRKGAKIQVSIGWKGQPLVNKGMFTVDEVTHSGAPDKLSIRARSADLRKGISDKREESHHGGTVGDLVNKVAARQGLTPAVSPDLASQPLRHLDQLNESDANMLTRLARELDAISTVKQGRLLFCRAGQATTVSGKPMSAMTITRSDGDQHSYTSADRDTYGGATASYHDHRTGQRADVSAGSAGGDNTKRLRHSYPDRASAQRAANAEMQRQPRGAAKMTLTLARGRPELLPETPVTVRGWKPQIDGTGWLIVKITHTIGDGGYTSQVEMEVKGGR